MSSDLVDWSLKSFRLHEQVSVTLVGERWGSGQIVDRSTTEYGGTRLYPVYCVRTASGNEGWFPLCALSKTD
jgi:hypothetical protein